MFKLYSLAREFARDLLFEINGDVVTLSIKGVLLANTSSTSSNFSIFEVSENEFILAIQTSGYVVYLGIEAEEEIEEEVYPSLVRIIISEVMPIINNLVQVAKELSYKGADILLDDNMSSSLREAMYNLLLKHKKGKSPYEQVEVA
ncbi:hypothetical protein PFDSM3638_06965 [Pyrococcus furiosus DSM 3638]|uniref:Uncharacterized protein n=3 Tax=Pyrococcus furiosus TaxID=2261 RepID=Q8U138_PYRFU|nr:hypothetical protein [Pyrococcus furiosus]AAL81515.1 hypothetical protein PF1391 [Pyrococcus furiosus DSM 3638]AFN04172.1 hypothetical protein PFC_06180 [Pyrococcus furiosus COM1]QEK79025.1 hypothetical protein PFDSM3638_06965 [Pyrococcus furiosus DSM 3638]